METIGAEVLTRVFGVRAILIEFAYFQMSQAPNANVQSKIETYSPVLEDLSTPWIGPKIGVSRVGVCCISKVRF